MTFTVGGLTPGQPYSIRVQVRPMGYSFYSSSNSVPFTPAGSSDTTPPNTTYEYLPSGTTNNPSYSVFSSESGSTFECQLSSLVLMPARAASAAEGWMDCDSSGNLANSFWLSEDTPYTFTIRAVDAAGNPDPTPLSSSFTYDSLSPETWITSENDDYITTDSITFSFDGQDTSPNNDFRNGAGFTQPQDLDFQCRMDGNEGPVFTLSPGPNDWQDCSSPTAYDNLSDGDHLFEVRSVDEAGNYDYSPASFGFTVDRQGNPQPEAPETWITSGPTGRVTSNDATFTFTGVRASSYECELIPAGGPTDYVPCESPLDYSDLADGSYRFAVRAISSGGVADPTPAIADFTVDTSGVQVVDCPAGNSAGVVCTVDADNVMTLRGTTGADSIVGTRRGDILRGRGGNDDMAGLGGADRLRGGSGHDTMAGGRGADRFLARDGQRDHLFGGPGQDTGRWDDLDEVSGI